MGGPYWPTGDTFSGNHWSASPTQPSSAFFSAVDDAPLLTGLNVAASFLLHDGTNDALSTQHLVLFSFTLPFSTNTDLATVEISGVTVYLSSHYQSIGSDIQITFSARRAGVDINFSSFTPSSTTTSWTITSSTPTTDPFTGGTWTLANLLATSFGFTLPSATGGSGNVLEIASFSLDIAEQTAIGGARAPLSPRLGEPAYFCAVCSRPLHLSSLTRVTDDEHPQYGLLVCSADYDIDPTDRDAESDRITEGDIDFEDTTR